MKNSLHFHYSLVWKDEVLRSTLSHSPVSLRMRRSQLENAEILGLRLNYRPGRDTRAASQQREQREPEEALAQVQSGL